MLSATFARPHHVVEVIDKDAEVVELSSLLPPEEDPSRVVVTIGRSHEHRDPFNPVRILESEHVSIELGALDGIRNQPDRVQETIHVDECLHPHRQGNGPDKQLDFESIRVTEADRIHNPFARQVVDWLPRHADGIQPVDDFVDRGSSCQLEGDSSQTRRVALIKTKPMVLAPSRKEGGLRAPLRDPQMPDALVEID